MQHHTLSWKSWENHVKHGKTWRCWFCLCVSMIFSSNFQYFEICIWVFQFFNVFKVSEWFASRMTLQFEKMEQPKRNPSFQLKSLENINKTWKTIEELSKWRKPYKTMWFERDWAKTQQKRYKKWKPYITLRFGWFWTKKWKTVEKLQTRKPYKTLRFEGFWNKT